MPSYILLYIGTTNQITAGRAYNNIIVARVIIILRF